MAIIKCKMCGGDLNLVEGASVAECEYCGSVQTVPKVDDEKKLTLFARANRLRAACDFDKAAGIYEAIVADFPGEAEAYWGLVLCKYGIEYVDDPVTGKKIPTCHRSSFDNVLDDTNLEQAMENADITAQKVYRQEAKEFERIRKGILEVSSSEQPYDIFICYKETASNGDRTLDSVLAQDLYGALTDKGYRVFFSRITLQGKLGEAYEPYIFAALNSAKVMLVVGTCYEYYNAVWVKNEWSRYLKLCQSDKTKHLIPCYKDLDPEDMPREFSHLQGADLSKMGAIQDVLFNMEKYIPLKKQTVIRERVVVGGGGNGKIESLLDRGNMALEDGDWAKADSFFEDVLNNDSKNAQAYLGKTLAQERCRTIDAFIRKRKDISQNAQGQNLTLEPDLAHVEQMVEKFRLPGYVEGSQIKQLYTFDLSYRSDVAERKRQCANEEAYWTDHKWLSKAEKFAAGSVAENIKQAKAALFGILSDRVKKAEVAENAAIEELQVRYAQHLQQADEKADGLYSDGLARREAHYQTLLQTARTSNDVPRLRNTAVEFEQLNGYRDSKDLAEHCRKRAAEEKMKLDEERKRQLQISMAREEKLARQRKKLFITVASVVCAVVALVLLITKVFIPNSRYEAAVALMDEGKYDEAIVAFEALDGYRGSDEKILDCHYGEAIALMEAKNYLGAISAFTALHGHRDSETKIQECYYIVAIGLMDEEEYATAIPIFERIGSYKDSADKVLACSEAILEKQYNEAVAIMEKEQYSQAISAFEALGGYRDSADKIDECNTRILDGRYNAAAELEASDAKGKAAIAFAALGDYKDARDRSLALWSEIADRDTVSKGEWHSAAVKENGEVLAVGWNLYPECLQVSGWKNIIAVSAGEKVTFGLKADGTVCVAGTRGFDVSGWKDIVALDNGGGGFALKMDGTVMVDHTYTDEMRNAIGQWQDVIAISSGSCGVAGLKSDGTVYFYSNYDEQSVDVSTWNNIVALSVGNDHVVGLKSDGTVVASGENNGGRCDVSGLRDVIAVGAGGHFTAALKKNGTVVTVGMNTAYVKDRSVDTSRWRNIVAIEVAGFDMLGLTSNGTVTAAREGNAKDIWSSCDVGGWRDIKLK